MHGCRSWTGQSAVVLDLALECRIRFGLSDLNPGPKARTIDLPLHKIVLSRWVENRPSLHSSPFEERCVGWFPSRSRVYDSGVTCTQYCSVNHLPQCCGLYTILFCWTDLYLYHKNIIVWWNMYPHKLQLGFFLNILFANSSAHCQVSSGSDIWTCDLRFQSER